MVTAITLPAPYFQLAMTGSRVSRPIDVHAHRGARFDFGGDVAVQRRHLARREIFQNRVGVFAARREFLFDHRDLAAVRVKVFDEKLGQIARVVGLIVGTAAVLRDRLEQVHVGVLPDRDRRDGRVAVMMHPRDQVVVHLGGAAGLAVGEDDDVLDLRAAVAERAFGLAQRGNQESLAMRREPVDHLIEIRAALPTVCSGMTTNGCESNPMTPIRSLSLSVLVTVSAAALA